MTSKWLPLTHTELLRWKAQQVRVAQDSYEVDKEETTMTSKQALEDIIDEMKYTENDGKTLTSYEQKRVDIIAKDLEVLEQIKVKIDEEIKKQEKVIIEYDNYAWKTQKLNTEYLIAFHIKNTLEKIKEGLENE